ncbi:hypothetical protein MOP88_08895 [Sphingomonas sp. WKB10]|nr:hypothetical protein [Sphingomonas sp. WKB10]
MLHGLKPAEHHAVPDQQSLCQRLRIIGPQSLLEGLSRCDHATARIIVFAHMSGNPGAGATQVADRNWITLGILTRVVRRSGQYASRLRITTCDKKVFCMDKRCLYLFVRRATSLPALTPLLLAFL